MKEELSHIVTSRTRFIETELWKSGILKSRKMKHGGLTSLDGVEIKRNIWEPTVLVDVYCEPGKHKIEYLDLEGRLVERYVLIDTKYTATQTIKTYAKRPVTLWEYVPRSEVVTLEAGKTYMCSSDKEPGPFK